MATFDQLGPRQRAILELILRRGKTYDEISGMLDMPIPRVRELAREALIELAPATSRSVDPQWRGQLSDYVLQQQSGPESKATVGHLRSSDSARLWASSLLDSLDTLYQNGQPEIPSGAPAPEPERPPEEERPRRGRSRGKGPSAPAGASSWANAVRAGRSGRRDKRDAEAADAGDPEAAGAGATGAAGTGASGRAGAPKARAGTATAGPSGSRTAGPTRRPGTSATPGAAVARRQAIIAVVAGVLILALLIGGVAYSLSGDEGSSASAPPPPPTGTPAPGGASPPGAPAGAPGAAGGEEPRVLGEVPLRASPGEEGQGRAFIAEQGGQRAVVVQSRGVQNVERGELLEVWFYNSRTDAKSVGAQRVQGGTFQGLGQLPPDWQRYRFIDVSRERADRRPGHSGDSVLRGPVEAAGPVQP